MTRIRVPTLLKTTSHPLSHQTHVATHAMEVREHAVEVVKVACDGRVGGMVEWIHVQELVVSHNELHRSLVCLLDDDDLCGGLVLARLLSSITWLYSMRTRW